MWAAALAAARVYVQRQLLAHEPELYQQLVAVHAALPDGTATVLTTIFSGLVATLAALLLRPRVLRSGIKNIVPFFAVAGSTALVVLVPIAIGLAITSLGLLSFGPMVVAYVAGRWLLLSAHTRLLLAFVLPMAVVTSGIRLYRALRRNGREGTLRLLWNGTRSVRMYLSFLLPFYTPFAIVLVGAFSLVWGASIGAFMFIQGEVFADWSGAARRRWPGMLALCELLFAYEIVSLAVLPCIATIEFGCARQGAVFDYFPITVRPDIKVQRRSTDDKPALRMDQRYLFCYHPHGVYAFGLFALLFGKRSQFHRLFQQEQRSASGGDVDRLPSPYRLRSMFRPEAVQERHAHRMSRSPSHSPSRSRAPQVADPTSQHQRGMLIGVANALLHVPMVCTFLSWFGFIPVAPTCLAEACSSEHNVALVPGGISEMTAFEGPHVEVISLLDRKGFIRLALQHGRDLVPVYGFGENRAFKQYTCFRPTRRRLARRLRLALHLFRGRWFTLIPFRNPIVVIVGSPIVVGPAVTAPTESQVDALHNDYCNAIKELYYANREAHGYADVDLVVV